MQNICLFTIFLTEKFVFFVILTEMIAIENFFYTQIISLPRFSYKSSYPDECITRDKLIITFQKTTLCIFRHISDIFKYKSDFFFLLFCYKTKHKKLVYNTWFKFMLTSFFWKLFRNTKKINVKMLYLTRKFNKIRLFSTKLNFYLPGVKNNKKKNKFSTRKTGIFVFLNFKKKIFSNYRYLYAKQKSIFSGQKFQISGTYVNKKYKNIKNTLKEKDLQYELGAFFTKKFFVLRQISLKKTQIAYFTKSFFFDTKNTKLDPTRSFYVKHIKIFRKNQIYHLKPPPRVYLQFVTFFFEKIFDYRLYKNVILPLNMTKPCYWSVHLFARLFIKTINIKCDKSRKYIKLYNINYVSLQERDYFTRKRLFFLKNILNRKKKNRKLVLNLLKAKFYIGVGLKYMRTSLNKNNISENKFCSIFFFLGSFSNFFYRKNYYFTGVKKILFLNFCLYGLFLNAQANFFKKKIHALVMLNMYIDFGSIEIFSFLIYFVIITKLIVNMSKFKYFGSNSYTNKEFLNAIVSEKGHLKLSTSLETITNYFVNKFGIVVMYDLTGVFLVLKQEKHRLGFMFCQSQINGIKKRVSYCYIYSSLFLNIISIFSKEKNKLFYKKKKQKIRTKIKLLKENLPANSFVFNSFFY